MHSAILDIETLALTPSAIITEISIISFDRRDHTVTDHLTLKPDFFEQLAAGRSFDADTIAFHRKNGTLPTDLAGQSTCHLVTALVEEFIRENRPERVWIQGTCFDRPIIEDFFAQQSRPLPWHFTKSRDARTAYDIAFPGQRHPKRPHQSLEDCQATLADLIEALTTLNRLESI